MQLKYDFDKIIDRSSTHTRAIDEIPIPNATVNKAFTKIPMWIADMNFETVPSIPREIIKRTEHPLYGYFNLPDEYFDAIINWQSKNNGVKLQKENIGYENGVLGGVVAVANISGASGSDILIHKPTYLGFTKSLKNSGFNLVHSPLYIDSDGIWRMDYEDMETKIKEKNIHTAVFCNPHNPAGRAWTKEEIEKAYEIYKKYDVTVVEDCIWSDLVINDNKFTPAQGINEDAKMRTVSFYAPSKTFNLAGLVGAYHIVYNKTLSDKLLKQSSLCYYNKPNVLSVSALIGGYNEEGHEWMCELRQALSNNVNYVYDYINEHFDGVKLQLPEATYLVYLDVSKWLQKHNMTLDELLNLGVNYGIIWQDGRDFLNPDTIRLNLALPHSLVKDAMDRLDKYVFNAN